MNQDAVEDKQRSQFILQESLRTGEVRWNI